jgi:stringent starvation protein A
MTIITKRTIMSLYSNNDDIYSHQVRIVLAEKGVNVEIIATNPNNPPSELKAINPYYSLPTLIDRELVLYEAGIIMEYLDERFPHPPLLPVYPVARAETRKMMFRIEQDWYGLMHKIQNSPEAEADTSRTNLLESLIALEPIFCDKPYFLSDEFSLLDCTLAPLLWRMSALKIEIPTESKGLHEYMTRVLTRESFQKSLTDSERQVGVA